MKSIDETKLSAELTLAHQSMLKSSPAYFASQMIKGPPDPPYNGKFLIGRHHLEWDKLVTGPKNVCVLASRNLGKSYFYSLALPLFYAAHQPGKATFIISSTQDTVGMIMERLKDQLENNDKLRWLMPQGKAKGAWNTTQIEMSNGHRIVVASMNTKKRGFHPDNIIGDDLLTDESAYSETIRRRQENFFMASVTPMLQPGKGKIIVVGTPQSARDLLVGNLQHNKAYEYRVYPGIVNGEPQWATRLSKEWLAARLEELGSITFAREIECKAVASGSSLFPIELFQGEPTEQYGLTLGMPREYWVNAGMSLYVGVDIAMSASVGADHTVVITFAVDVNGAHWIVDLQRVKGMPYHEQLALVKAVGNKYQPSVIAIESNAAQVFLADTLIRTTNLPIVKTVTTAQKHSLENGLPSLKLMFENRKLRLPRGDEHSLKMTDLLIDEFGGFTFLNGRVQSVGSHDDVPMAFYTGLQGVKKGTFSVSFGSDTLIQSGQPVPATPLEVAQKQQAATAQVDPNDPFGMRRSY